MNDLIYKIVECLGFSNEDEEYPNIEYISGGNVMMTLPGNFYHIHSKNLKEIEDVLDGLYDYSIFVSTTLENAPLCLMIIPIPN